MIFEISISITCHASKEKPQKQTVALKDRQGYNTSKSQPAWKAWCHVNESKFIAKNEAQWKALEAFNRRFVKTGALKAGAGQQEIREFARLFRLASHHLAYAKTHYPAGQALPYLNRLVGVAHNYFYVRERGSFADIWAYFAYTFPKAVRESWRYWTAAAAFFVLGLIFAGFYVAGEPDRLGDIMPGMAAEGFAEGLFPDEHGQSVEFSGLEWDYALMSAVITTNNIAVSFNAFVWGILGGLGTIFVLVYNGLIVGGLFGYLKQGGADMLVAYSLILPHGVLELAAIFLCGGCGLMLGRGLLIPGRFTRKHSFVMYAKKAARLIPGIVAMLVVAGLIEGFFTPLAISAWFKIIFAVLTGVGFVAYVNPFAGNRI